MALSAFVDPTSPPAPAELDATLARRARVGRAGCRVPHHAGDVTATWASRARGSAGRCASSGRRVLVYLTPQAGRVLVGVVLGEKAIAVAAAAGLASGRTLEVMAAAQRYAEGRAVRFRSSRTWTCSGGGAGADQAREVVVDPGTVVALRGRRRRQVATVLVP